MRHNRKIRVFVAEDESPLLKNIIKKLEAFSEDFTVVGSAYDGQEAMAKILALKPHILLTDIKMPGMDGLQLIKSIKDMGEDVQSVILSGYDDFEYARTALKYQVADYLLKPVKPDELQVVLYRLREKILEMQEHTEREILTSQLSTGERKEALPFSFAEENFMLFLVRFGNLKNRVIDFAEKKSQFEGAERQSLLENFLQKDKFWWLIEETVSSQYFLIVATRKNQLEYIGKMAEQLEEALRVETCPLTIVSSGSYISYQNISGTAQSMRELLQSKLIVGSSQILVLSPAESSERKNISLSVQQMNQLATLIRSENIEAFQQFFKILFEGWKKEACPQVLLEKMLLQMLHLMENSFECSHEHVKNYEYEIYRHLYEADSWQTLFDGLKNLFHVIFADHAKQCSGIHATMENIEADLKKNFASNFTIEELARKFNFNPSYLTRAFKKSVGESPMKYIIRLRMEEAKKLLSENRELNIKEISELTGYEDQHYFSRIFKEFTGMTPSECRNRLE